MMQSFLTALAEEIVKNHPENIRNLTVVLPTKRALRHLSAELRRLRKDVFILPELITMGACMEKIAGLTLLPPATLLAEAYSAYLSVSSEDPEDMSSFSEWMEPALDDFNDLDMALADPEKVFRALKDIYLLSQWDPEYGGDSSPEDTFVSNLEAIYRTLQSRLIDKKTAYKGLIYRRAAENVSTFLSGTDGDIYFAGFSLLSPSEIEVIHEILIQNRGRIFWDIPPEMKEQTGISVYFRQWKYYRTKDCKADCIGLPPVSYDQLKITGVSGRIEMTKYLATELTGSNVQTAVVMANQQLLPPLLNHLHSHTEELNVSIPLPVNSYPLSEFIFKITDFILKRQPGEDKTDPRFIRTLLADGYLHSISKEIHVYEESLDKEQTYEIDIRQWLKKLPNEESPGALLGILFTLKDDDARTIVSAMESVFEWLKPYTSGIDREILFRHAQSLSSVKKIIYDYSFYIDKKALFRMYRQIVSSRGIRPASHTEARYQILGFRESRLLPFERIILSSVNEGVLPRSYFHKGYFPPDVRYRFGMETRKSREEKDKYDFYRLFRQSQQLELVYNTEKDALDGGEVSRFISYLLWQHPEIEKRYYTPELKLSKVKQTSIPGETAIRDIIREWLANGISPTAVITYLYNPVNFYYRYILKVPEPRETSDYMDLMQMGTLLHESLHVLYQSFIGKQMKAEHYKEMENAIEKTVNACYRDIRGKKTPKGQDVLITAVVKRYIRLFLGNEKKQVEAGDSLQILALEKSYDTEYELSSGEKIRLKGNFDRVDRYNGTLRIIDYKTGKVVKSDLEIKEMIRETYFCKEKAKAIQLLMYATIYLSEHDDVQSLQAGIVSFGNLRAGFLPLNIEKEKIVRHTHTESFKNHFGEFVRILTAPGHEFAEPAG